MSALLLPARKAGRLPPGPADSGSLQALRLLRDGGPYLLEARERFGKVFTLRPLQSPPLVVVADHELAHEVYAGDAAVLLAGAANRIVEPASGPGALLFLDGQDHMARRRLLLSALRDSEAESYEAILREVTSHELDRCEEGQPISLHAGFRRLTTEVMLRIVLGADTLGNWPELRSALSSIQLPASRDAARSALRQILRADPDGQARRRVLSALTNSRDARGRVLSEPAILDELLALLVAGQETTAGTLAWSAERLCRHPDVQTRLRHAMLMLEGERYGTAVVTEILRSRPVLQWSLRRLARPLALSDWRLPEGAVVAVSIFLLHHDPDLFEHPDEFIPERFLDAHAPSPGALVPFGGGVRRCLGARLAMLEIRTALASMLQRFELRPPQGEPGDEGSRRSGITYVPAKGACVQLRAADALTGPDGECAMSKSRS
jgi:cytochrome P450